MTERELGLDVVVNPRLRASVSYASTHSREDTPHPFSISSGSSAIYATGLRGNTVEGTIQARLLNLKNGLQWDIGFVGDHRETKISKWQATCFYVAFQKLCEGSDISDIWGQRLLRNKNDLPTRYSASTSSFDINDEGFVCLLEQATAGAMARQKTCGAATC